MNQHRTVTQSLEIRQFGEHVSNAGNMTEQATVCIAVTLKFHRRIEHSSNGE